VEDSAAVVYCAGDGAGHLHQLRQRREQRAPEAAFGIAQIGKSFRNEITPGNFVFRTREFEQMEMEYFLPPGDDDKCTRTGFKTRSRVRALRRALRRLRLREHQKDELAHYSTAAPTSSTSTRSAGASSRHRQARQLRPHAAQQGCGKEQSFFDEEKKAHYIPHVVEPAAGCDRTAITFLVDAYESRSSGSIRRRSRRTSASCCASTR